MERKHSVNVTLGFPGAVAVLHHVKEENRLQWDNRSQLKAQALNRWRCKSASVKHLVLKQFDHQTNRHKSLKIIVNQFCTRLYTV